MVAVRELAREHTREAVEALVAIMRDPHATASARISAASELLDRGHGRAPATLEVAAEVRRPLVELSDDELRQIAAQARAKLPKPVE